MPFVVRIRAWFHIQILCRLGRHSLVAYMSGGRAWCYWCDVDTAL